MGYYTDFTIRIKDDVNNVLLGDDSTKKRIVEYIKSLDEGDYLKHLIEDGEFIEDNFINGKWYDWADDMKKLSTSVPDVLFEVFGEGEEKDDLWKAYILNGKVQECAAKVTVEYPEFDIKKMK